MKYEISHYDSDKFIKGDSKTLEQVLKNVYKLSIEAINNNELDSIIDLFNGLSSNFERVENCLNIEGDKNRSIFYYGMLKSLVTLIVEFCETKSEKENVLFLFNKYQLLYPVLDTINTSRKVSGQELKKALHFKSESNLTNFVSRIRSYNFIYIQKLGNTNFYSLTPKGKKSLLLYIMQKNEKASAYINESILLELLDEISKQLKEEEPSLFSVINVFSHNKIELKNRNAFKIKINTIFASREEYVKMKLKFSCEEKMRKFNIESERNVYFNDESCYTYESDNEQVIDYHNW